ncbi:hypothetical protein [Actinoplanes sp. NPDC051851]|uniref:FIMAH domain-containing protein n=1 Tax=Actinoplanes sp. NPDC051851 TaxID=3154753 RepID=UPI0034460CF9
MADLHDPESRDPSPTASLPVVEASGVYRAANHRRVAIAAGAGGAVLLAAVIWMLSSGGDGERSPAAAPGATATTAAATEEPGEEISTGPAATASTTTPAATASNPSLTPDQLVDQLDEAIDLLAENGEIDDDDAESLAKRLDKVADEIEDRDAEKAARKLQDFAEKLVDLHDDEDLSDAGFQALSMASTQLAQVLPQIPAEDD